MAFLTIKQKYCILINRVLLYIRTILYKFLIDHFAAIFRVVKNACAFIACKFTHIDRKRNGNIDRLASGPRGIKRYVYYWVVVGQYVNYTCCQSNIITQVNRKISLEKIGGVRQRKL